MTPQEAIDKAVPLIRKQGKPAGQTLNTPSGSYSCYYSSLDKMEGPELFCAIGIMLTPEQAREVENCDIPEDFTGTSESYRLEKACNILRLDYDSARKLQACHDEAGYQPETFVETFNLNVSKLCKNFGLTYPEPE